MNIHAAIFLSIPVLLLLGSCRPQGPAFRMPESEAGFAPATFRAVEYRMRREYLAGQIPAASLTIHRGGEIVYQDSFGSVPHEGGAAPVTGATLFDVASLAKPLVGAPLAWTLLEEGDLPARDRDLLEAIVEGRAGLRDEELLPHVRSLMNTAAPPDGEAVLLGRLWLETMRGGHAGADGRARYSNYSWAFLSVYPLVEPAAGRALHGHDPLWLSAGFTFRPGSGRAVAPSGWRGLEPLQGRPHDPFADFLVTQWRIPPSHSGLFASSGDVAVAMDGLLRAGGKRAALARWFLEEIETPYGEEAQPVRRLRGGLRCVTGTPFAPEGTRPGRFFFVEGYTGCLLWVDMRTTTVVALLTNVTMEEDRRPWERFARDILRIVQRGVSPG